METVTYRCVSGHGVVVNADAGASLADCPWHPGSPLAVESRLIVYGGDSTTAGDRRIILDVEYQA